MKLDSAVLELRKDTSVNLNINSCLSTKTKQQKLIWRRIDAISDYIEKGGIAANRIVFVYDGYPEDCNVIEINFYTLSNSAPPHPKLQKKRQE